MKRVRDLFIYFSCVMVLCIFFKSYAKELNSITATPSGASSIGNQTLNNVTVNSVTANDILLTIERGELSRISEATFKKMLTQADPSAMLEAGILMLKKHPTYISKLTKWERIKGEWPKDPDIIQLKYQRAPKAFYAEWSFGPNKGRRVLYNQAHRPNEILAREAGILGIMSLHLNINNPLTKRDTNHTILELGLEYPLVQCLSDMKKLIDRGHKIDPLEGGKWLEENGHRYWEVTVKSPGPPEYYTSWAKMKFDIERGILVGIEIRDQKNIVLEKVIYENIEFVTFPTNAFNEKNPSYKF